MSFESLPRSVQGIVGSTVEYISEVSSTNDNLLFREECPEGHVLVTDLQTAGRGRAGHRWSASGGENLLFSFSFSLHSSTPLFALIPVLSALAVCEGIETIGGVMGIQTKWPNDVVFDERKLGGILIESRVRGEHARLVGGIGVNVNQSLFPPDIAESATSVSLLRGAPVDRALLLAAIIDELNRYFFHVSPAEGVALYSRRCSTIGRGITFESDGLCRKGHAVGVDEHGRLLVETEGKVLAFSGSEVSHVQAGSA